LSENPFQAPADPANADQNPTPSVSSGRAAYNVVSDTMTGVNVRWSDNKFQAAFVFVSVAVTSPAGALLAALNPRWNLPWPAGALMGAFAGLVIGIFASGIFLMFYRVARHIKGKND
jgi:hypothetical protein